MKKVGFLFVIILFFAVPLTGCDFGKSAVDYSIDMTPRMVTLTQANAEDVVSAVSVASVAIRASSTKTEAIGSGVAVETYPAPSGFLSAYQNCRLLLSGSPYPAHP